MGYVTRALGLPVTTALAVAGGCSVTGGLEAPYPPPRVLAAQRAADSAAIEALEARAREVIADCIRRVGERMGRPDPDPGAVQVEVAMGPRWLKSMGCAFGYGSSMKIELCAEAFLSGELDLDLVASHEGVHAYFSRQLNWWQRFKIPPWLLSTGGSAAKSQLRPGKIHSCSLPAAKRDKSETHSDCFTGA